MSALLLGIIIFVGVCTGLATDSLWAGYAAVFSLMALWIIVVEKPK